MNHEDIKIGTQYTINRDRPSDANLQQGEQVVVKEMIPTPFKNVPDHVKVESLGFVPQGIPVFTWLVRAEDLDEANPDWVDPNAPEPDGK